MNIDNIRAALAEVRAAVPWDAVLLYGVPALLIVSLLLAAVSKRPDRRVSLFATVIGLGWMAWGMWDSATTVYDTPPALASILFLLFESFMASAMLRANRYRDDFARRARHVRWVWTLAVIAGVVIALAEGWAQAPLRLAVPLMVAGNWFIDLTADDDPAIKPKTSVRWTLRNLALYVGAIEPGERDATAVNRDRLRDRMTRLAFRIQYGTPALNDALRRKVRLARLKTLADDADLAEVRARLARMNVDLTAEPEVHPVPPPQPSRKEIVRPDKPADPDNMPQGVHLLGGRTLRGAELHEELVRLVIESAGPGRPTGMSNEQIETLTTPALRQRTAEKIGAEARRRLRAQRVNGSVPDLEATAK